jgi:hypothetical protein
MNATRAALVTAALALVGCMSPEEGIALATARIEGVAPCVGCRDVAAVTVNLAGDDALPNALVVVYDLRITLDLGQRPAALVRADGRGRWKATLRGLRVPNRAELPVHAGDTLEVFQRDGEGAASIPFRIAVPSPDVEQRPAPPIVEPDEPQASDPWPNPSGH